MIRPDLRDARCVFHILSFQFVLVACASYCFESFEKHLDVDDHLIILHVIYFKCKGDSLLVLFLRQSQTCFFAQVCMETELFEFKLLNNSSYKYKTNPYHTFVAVMG